MALLWGGCGAGEQPVELTQRPTPKVHPPPPPNPRHGLTSEQVGQVLATVGDRQLTLGELTDNIARQSPYLRARYETVEQRRALLEQWLRLELLSQEATRLGYMERPETKEAMEQTMVQALLDEHFGAHFQQPADIKLEEIRTYYDAHRADFSRPAQVRASHIVVANRSTAQRLITRLKRESMVDRAERFRALAKDQSLDKHSAATGGDLRFFGQQANPAQESATVPQAVRVAAFNLDKTGDLHPAAVASPAGFHVIMLTAKRDALERSFEDVERTIRQQLWRAKREAAITAFVDNLRAKLQVQENLAPLAQLTQPAAPDSTTRDPQTAVP